MRRGAEIVVLWPHPPADYFRRAATSAGICVAPTGDKVPVFVQIESEVFLSILDFTADTPSKSGNMELS